MKKRKIPIFGIRGKKPQIVKVENSEKEQYERVLTIQIIFKDYTGKNLINKEIKKNALEKIQLGKLDKYLRKKFPEKEIKTQVTSTKYLIVGIVCIR